MLGNVLGWTFFVTFVAIVAQLTKSDPRNYPAAVSWVVSGFIGNLVLNTLIMYFLMPAMTGPFLGMQCIWLTLLINIIIAWVAVGFSSEHARSATASVRLHAAVGLTAAFGVLVVVVLFTWIFTTWTNANAKPLAAYPNVVVSESSYPETDTSHMVIVTEEIARYKGGQVIASGGQNLGSMYHAADYNLQSVDKHLYWIAPLIYNNIWANLTDFTSPGLVVVDAEDPDQDAMLKLDYKLHYLPEALLGQDLIRYLYTHGYSGYRMIDPTLEVDDDWVPYFTVDVSSYVRGLTGVRVLGVVVLDSGTGEINQYSLDEVPVWIDRTIPGDAAQQYVDWWGSWHNANWFNPSGRGAEMSADDTPDIAYSSAESSPVWQFVMTSQSSKDHSSTGVILFDSRQNKANLYRSDKVLGLAVGSDVIKAFETNPNNLKNYQVSGLILHNIYGELTWLGIFESPLEDGSNRASFQGIGLLNVKSIQGSDVIMATNKEEALREYKRWISNKGSNAIDPTQVEDLKEVEGFVERFAVDTQSGETVYGIVLRDMEGNLVQRIFTGSSTGLEKLPYTKEGDHVVIQYFDNNERIVGISKFNNLSLEIFPVDPQGGEPQPPVQMPTATPTMIHTPTPTPNSLFEPTPTP